MAEKETSSEVKASIDRPHAGKDAHVDATKPFGDNWGAHKIEVYAPTPQNPEPRIVEQLCTKDGNFDL